MSFGRTYTLNTSHKMPAIGYGTLASPGEVSHGVYEALKTGYRHLDLAKVYRNQREVGQGIKKALAEVPGLKREDIFITSKLWNNKHLPEEVEGALDDTLAELGLEYLDLYLMHWPVAFKNGDELFPKNSDNSEYDLDRGVSVSQTWNAMLELPKSKVRSIGVSNFTIEHLEALITATGVVPAVNQVERHPRLPDNPLMEYCAKKKIIITAYAAFGNNDHNIPLLVNHPEIRAIAERLSAQGNSATPAQVLIAWAVIGGHGVIPKSVKVGRIKENFQEIQLDGEAIQAIKKLGDSPQRFNIPYTYVPKWDINLFGDDAEKSTKGAIIIPQQKMGS